MLSRSTIATTTRWATVLLTITAWILLSNHCALGLSGPAVSSDSETGGCPMHSAPGKEKPAANIPCCKELRAVTISAAKSIAAVARHLVDAEEDYLAVVFVVPPRMVFHPAFWDTGPPRARSFAESVLQRSVLAHAPPAIFERV